MSDLSELIARLEVATEGGPTLDACVDAARYGRTITSHDGPHEDAIFYHLERYFYARPDGTPGMADAPPYTTSIDAALTLVPEGCAWVVNWPAYKLEDHIGGMGKFKYQSGKTFAGVRASFSSHLGSDYEAYGATPALALCIAALKARA